MSTVSEIVMPDDAVEEPSDSLEVHRDGALSLLIGASAGVLAVAFLLRGVGSGGALAWALFAITGAVAVMHLAAVVDARAPLFVLDALGVRVRRGAAWQGLAWSDVDHVEHLSRSTTLRDGSLTVVATDGRRLGVRLSLSTRLVGADWHEVDEALGELSGGAVPIVGRAELAERSDSSESLAVSGTSGVVEAPDGDTVCVDRAATDFVDPALAESGRVAEPEIEVVIAPHREPRRTMRGEVLLESRVADDAGGDGQTDASPAAATQTIVLGALHDGPDDGVDPAAPVAEPVVGAQLASARERVGVSVESLAERTRIRPHVIEAIERDDFESCGGDFYARGHLRTLARVLGVDAAELLALYDERYAHAPIDPRRVFEAELAAAPSRTQGSRGLNWSVLVAVVMAVVLVWSVARLVMDGPVPLSDQPVLNGSPGGRATLSGATTKVPVSLTAATGGARVIVRDARQQVVFDAQLAFMQTAELTAAPPVRISTTDGGLLVTVDDVDEGAMGATGQDAQRTYVP